MKPKKKDLLEIVLYLFALVALTYFVIVFSNTYDNIAYTNMKENSKNTNIVYCILQTFSNIENPNYKVHISENTSKFIIFEFLCCFLYMTYKMTTKKNCYWEKNMVLLIGKLQKELNISLSIIFQKI